MPAFCYGGESANGAGWRSFDGTEEREYIFKLSRAPGNSADTYAEEKMEISGNAMESLSVAWNPGFDV